MHTKEELYDNIHEARNRSKYYVTDVCVKELNELFPEDGNEPRWLANERSIFIETLLLGILPSVIVLRGEDKAHSEILDGYERIRAVNDFRANKFALNFLMRLHCIEGVYYSDLPAAVRREFDNMLLRALIFEKDSDRDIAVKTALAFNHVGVIDLNLSRLKSRGSV